jgi:hypothetical protein
MVLNNHGGAEISCFLQFLENGDYCPIKNSKHKEERASEGREGQNQNDVQEMFSC